MTTPEAREVFLPQEAIDAAIEAVDRRVHHDDVRLILRAADKHLGWQDAGRSTVWAAEALLGAKTLAAQSNAVTQLANAASDLASWLDGYDEKTGELRDPDGDDER